jgi:hypothetical protein
MADRQRVSVLVVAFPRRLRSATDESPTWTGLIASWIEIVPDEQLLSVTPDHEFGLELLETTSMRTSFRSRLGRTRT